MPSATRAAMGVSAYQLRLSLPCFRPGKLPGNQRLEMAFRWKSHLQLFLILRGRGRGLQTESVSCVQRGTQRADPC